MKKLLYTFVCMLLVVAAIAQTPTLLLEVNGSTPNPLSDKTGTHTIKNTGSVYDDNGIIVFPASSNQYLYIDSIGNRIDMNKNWRFECKIKVKDSTDEVAIIDFRSTSTTGNMYFNYNRYGQGIHFSDRAVNGEKGALIADSTLLPQNVWVDLKLEFINDTLRLFRNGTMVKDTIITATLSLSATTTIGYSQDRRTARDTVYMDDIKFFAIDTTLTTNIVTINIEQVGLYPNPANSTVVLRSKYHVNRGELFDVSGKLIKEISISNNTIDVSNLVSGLYYIKAYGDNRKVIQARFIKK